MTGNESNTNKIYQFFEEVVSLPSRLIALAGIVLILLLPLMFPGSYYLDIILFSAILVIYASSWNLLSGLAGQFSFGHAFLLAGAAYMGGLLNVYFSVSPWICFLLTPVMGALLGIVMFIPSLRITGATYGIASFAFPTTLAGLVVAFPEITGGSKGLTGVGVIFPESGIIEYYFVILLMIGTGLVFWKIFHSKLGIIANSIREDEEFTESVGINTTKYRLYLFMVSGIFAGLAGGCYVFVYMDGLIGPTAVSVHFNFMPILFSVFGGIGVFYGPILGVFTMEPLISIIRGFGEYGWLIMGIVLVGVLIFLPMGLYRRLRDVIEKTCPKCKTRNWAVDEKCRKCGENL